MESSPQLLGYAPAHQRKRASLWFAVAAYCMALGGGFLVVVADLVLSKPALREAFPAIPIFEALNAIGFVPTDWVARPRSVLILFVGLASLGFVLSFTWLRPSAQARRWPYICAAVAGPGTLALWCVVAMLSHFHDYLDKFWFLFGAYCLALVMTSFLTTTVMLWIGKRISERPGPRWLIIAAAILLAPLLIAISGIFTWSPLNCWHDDVDIRTGRIRHTWYLLYHKVSDRTEDSPLAEVLGPGAVIGMRPEWRRVNTFSPLTHLTHYSPHYSYHGAIAEMKELQMVWELTPFTPAAKRAVASNLLRLWQRDGSYWTADRYVQAVSDLGSDEGKAIDVGNLPPLPSPDH